MGFGEETFHFGQKMFEIMAFEKQNMDLSSEM